MESVWEMKVRTQNGMTYNYISTVSFGLSIFSSNTSVRELSVYCSIGVALY